jgi:MFS family permease
MVVIGKQRQEDVSDPMLTRLLEDDRTPWYRKRNLRSLYLVLFPAAMGIEITSGFDSQIINTVQIVPSWNKCKAALSLSNRNVILTDGWLDFGSPTGNIKNGVPEYAIDPALKGFLGAAYSLGAICALPFIPWVNQRFGRRWTIFIGSIISLIGALIQGFSNGGTYGISLGSVLHG